MDGRDKILITGASGLLGRSLVRRFIDGGWFVFAHYYQNKGVSRRSCEWLYGDFSTLEKTRDFMEKNTDKLMECRALINNYGPITYKDTGNIKTEDLISDFHGNVVVANEIISAFLMSGNLMSVVNVAFDGVGEVKPYKKILPYAIAKSGIELLTLSYDREFSGIDFSLVSPPPVEGGEFGKSSGALIKPEEVAEEIFGIVKKRNNV
ncbi:MAG: SDR family oxidoreductase [Acidobacteriota bacterium]